MQRSKKYEIPGEASFLQMLDVLRKGKLMTRIRCRLPSEQRCKATLMQKCNNDLSKNTPRAKSLQKAQRTNRIKNYPPCGR